MFTHFPKCLIYVSVNQVSIGSDNGFSLLRCQAIIWTSAELLAIEPLETKISEIFNRNIKRFIQENAFESIVCEKGGYFVQGEMS